MVEEQGDTPVAVRLSKAQATAAAAVLRGYLTHQRERLGDRAGTNPNFQAVEQALEAFDAQLAGPRQGHATTGAQAAKAAGAR